MANKVVIEFKPEGDRELVNAIKALDKATKSLLNTQAKIRDANAKTTASTDKYKNSIKLMRHDLLMKGKTLKDLKVPLHVYKSALKGNSFALGVLRKTTSAYINDLKRLQVQQKKNSNSTQRHSSGLFELGHSARQTGGAFSVLRSQLLLFNFAMTLGVRQLIRFTSEANQIEAMSRAFSNLQGGTNNASIALDKLQKATNGTMKSFDLFQQANNAMILGVSKNSDEMAEMFDIAQRLGHALGRDTRSSVESLITGIGRQSRLMLDNIGIIVKSDEAYKNYAKEINKTVDSLTDADKKQAFLNETMESARRKVASLPDEYIDNAMALQQLSVEFNELAIRIGEVLTPIVTVATKHLTELAKSIDKEKIQELGTAIIVATELFVAYKVAVGLASLANRKFAISASSTGIGVALVAIGVALAYVTDEALKTKMAYMELTDEIERHIREIKGIKRELENLEEVEAERDERIKEQIKLMDSLQKAREGRLKEEIRLLKLSEEERQKILDKRAKVEQKLIDFRKKFGKENVKEHINMFTKMAQKDVEYEEFKEQQRKHEEEKEKNAFGRMMAIHRMNDKVEMENMKAHNEKLAQQANNLHAFRGSLERERTEELKKEQVRRTNVQMAETNEIHKRVQEEIDLAEKRNKEVLKKDKELLKKAKEFEAMRLQRQKDIATAEQIIYADNLAFQLDQIDQQAKRFEELLGKQVAITEFAEQAKINAVLRNLEETSVLYHSFEAGYSTFIDSLLDLDQSFEDKKKAILESTARAFVSFLATMAKEQLKQAIAGEAIESATQASSIAKSKATGLAIASNYSVPAGLASVATGGATAIAGLTALIAVMASVKAMGKFEQGGLVGGNRHSQGGTMIEAERGEFVMSRNAVQAIGVETLNQMNQGGSAGITINVSAPLVDETILDTIIPAIEEAQRMNLA